MSADLKAQHNFSDWKNEGDRKPLLYSAQTFSVYFILHHKYNRHLDHTPKAINVAPSPCHWLT